MPRIRFSCRIASLSVASKGLLIAGFLWSSPGFAESPEPAVAKAPKMDIPSPAEFGSALSYQMYNALVGEMYGTQGDMQRAMQHYLAASMYSDDPKLAQRATEFAMQSEDPDKARKALEHWSELSPESAESRQYRILLNTRAGRYDEALKDIVWLRDYVEKKDGHGFEFILSLLALETSTKHSFEVFKRYAAEVDDSAKAQLVVATLALNNEAYDDALKAADKVKKDGTDAQKAQALRVRSKALLGLQKVDEAIATLQPLIKDTEDQDLKLDYARMLVLADRRAEATPIFKQLYAKQPDDMDVLYTLGLLYLEQEEYAFAEPLMKKLLDAPERKNEARYFLAQIYEGQKRFDDAIVEYENALKGSFYRESIGRASNLIRKEQGEKAALEWIDARVAEADNDDDKGFLWLGRGQMLHESDQYKDALSAFDTALSFYNKLEPAKAKRGKLDVVYARALTHEQVGSFDDAEKDLRSLLKDEPEDARLLNALGYMLVINTKRYDEARKLLDKAFALVPNDPAIMDSMAWIMYKQGEVSEAEVLLLKAYEAMPDPEIASHLIEVLSVQGKLDEARKILKEMLAKHPDDKLLKQVRDKHVGL